MKRSRERGAEPALAALVDPTLDVRGQLVARGVDDDAQSDEARAGARRDGGDRRGFHVRAGRAGGRRLGLLGCRGERRRDAEQVVERGRETEAAHRAGERRVPLRIGVERGSRDRANAPRHEHGARGEVGAQCAGEPERDEPARARRQRCRCGARGTIGSRPALDDAEPRIALGTRAQRGALDSERHDHREGSSWSGRLAAASRHRYGRAAAPLRPRRRASPNGSRAASRRPRARRSCATPDCSSTSDWSRTPSP